jgi:polar amino acid transport system substrate-binding protein
MTNPPRTTLSLARADIPEPRRRSAGSRPQGLEPDSRRKQMSKGRIGFWMAAALPLLVMACGGSGSTAEMASPSANGVSAAVVAELAPTGKLRVALTEQPPAVAKVDPATGSLSGIGVDFGRALAAQLRVPFTLLGFANPGAALAAVSGGSADLAVVPLVAVQQPSVSATTPIFLIQHTYMVRADSPLQAVQDVDRAGIRVASVTSDGHTPFLMSHLTHAQLVQVSSDRVGLDELRTGQVDAFAGGRFGLASDLGQVPGARLLTGSFFNAQIGIAALNGHADASAFMQNFVNQQVNSGAIQTSINALSGPGFSVPGSATAG